MGGIERFADWVATLLVASTAWLTGLAVDGERSSGSSPSSTMMAWSQDGTDTTIQPAEEEDIETLDAGTPPAAQETLDQGTPPLEQETLDQGAVPLDPTGQEDIELLDQGSSPASVAPVSAEPLAVAAEPVAGTAYAPVTAMLPVEAGAAQTGPVLPPGFGSGRVQVAAGPAGFPAGLESCHVGAVTGRAYVGIDCEEHGSIVGHAPLFDEFPFGVQGEFPFDDEPFSSPLVTVEPDDVTTDVFVSSAPGSDQLLVGDPTSPTVTADATASVTLAQRTRNREPRVRVETEAKETGSVRASDKRGRESVSNQREDDARDELRSESKEQAAKEGKQGGKQKGKDKNAKKVNDKERGKENDKQKKQGSGKKSDKKRSGQKR